MGCRDGHFCFCPIEGDIHGAFVMVEGMNFVSAAVPAGLELVAIIHPDGQGAVEAFCAEYAPQLAALKSDSPAPSVSD